MIRSLAPLAAAVLALAGCAMFQHEDPPKVTLVGVEPAAGEGLEERMQLKLRVQNPNEKPIDYDGIYVEVDLQGKSFGSGVSNASGTVPGFGETVVTVPLTISVLGIVSDAISMMSGSGSLSKITYEMRGKLDSPTSGAVRFESQGEWTPTGDAVKQ